MLILFFGVKLRWLPVSGTETLAAFRHAGDRARLLRHARLHAADPRRHDGGAGLRLHPHRARQGPAAADACCSSTRCATRSSRWWRWPRCSSASCSAARSSSRPSSRSTGSAISPGSRSPRNDFPVMQAIVLVLVADLRAADAGRRPAQRLARSAHPGGVMARSRRSCAGIPIRRSLAPCAGRAAAARASSATAASLIGGTHPRCRSSLMALLAPLLAPHDPYDQDLAAAPRSRRSGTRQGSWAHPLGTDQLGRDYLSRLHLRRAHLAADRHRRRC